MKKEYTKRTIQMFDENMNPMTEIEEIVSVSLIADTGKKIYDARDNTFCSRVDIGTNDSEKNYTEVDDPTYIEVIDEIVKEAAE